MELDRKTAFKIGIIRAGNIGGTLTRRFTALRHKVYVANSRGRDTLADLAAETGATAVTVEEATGPAGGLDASSRQQPDKPGYATDLDANGARRTLAKGSKERKPEWRATPSSPGTYEDPA
jgi:hypothetical protein